MTAPVEQPEAMPDLALWLAVQHQAEQQKIADKTAAGLALLWSVLKFSRINDSVPGWLHSVTLQTEQSFRASEQAAFDFVQGTKFAIEPLSKPLKKIATAFPTRDFQAAMSAAGPGSVKRATQRAFTGPVVDSGGVSAPSAQDAPNAGVSAIVDDLMALGKLNSTGAGVKFALNGGRGEVQQLVIADAKTRDAPIGWARFTEDSENGPCYFCALLASQGAVYLSGNSFAVSNSRLREPPAPRGAEQKAVADLLAKLDAAGEKRGIPRAAPRAFVGNGPAKVHDHCKCTMRPVYREEDGMDERAQFFLDQWRSAPYGAGGKDSIRQFRRVYERPKPYDVNPRVNLEMMRRNRDLVVAELGASSANARWWDKNLRALEAKVFGAA